MLGSASSAAENTSNASGPANTQPCDRDDKQALFKLKAKSMKLTPLSMPTTSASEEWLQSAAYADGDASTTSSILGVADFPQASTATSFLSVPSISPIPKPAAAAGTASATSQNPSSQDASAIHVSHPASATEYSHCVPNYCPASAHPSSAVDNYAFMLASSHLHARGNMHQQNLNWQSPIGISPLSASQQQLLAHQNALNNSYLMMEQSNYEQYKNNLSDFAFENSHVRKPTSSRTLQCHNFQYPISAHPQLASAYPSIGIHSAPIYSNFPDLPAPQTPILIPLAMQHQKSSASESNLPTESVYGRMSPVTLPLGPISFIPKSAVYNSERDAFHPYRDVSSRQNARRPHPYSRPSASPSETIHEDMPSDKEADPEDNSPVNIIQLPAAVSLQRLGMSGLINKTVHFTNIQNPYLRRNPEPPKSDNIDVCDIKENQVHSRTGRYKRTKLAPGERVMSNDPDYYGFTSISSRAVSASTFNQNVMDFLTLIGKKVERVPCVDRKVLNFWALFHAVLELGGYEHVTKARKWKRVASVLRLPSSLTSSSYTLRTCFDQFLLDYERQFLLNHAGTSMAHNICITPHGAITPRLPFQPEPVRTEPKPESPAIPMESLSISGPVLPSESINTVNSQVIVDVDMTLSDPVTAEQAFDDEFSSMLAASQDQGISNALAMPKQQKSTTPTRTPELSTATTPAASSIVTQISTPTITSMAATPTMAANLSIIAANPILDASKIEQFAALSALIA